MAPHSMAVLDGGYDTTFYIPALALIGIHEETTEHIREWAVECKNWK